MATWNDLVRFSQGAGATPAPSVSDTSPIPPGGKPGLTSADIAAFANKPMLAPDEYAALSPAGRAFANQTLEEKMAGSASPFSESLNALGRAANQRENLETAAGSSTTLDKAWNGTVGAAQGFANTVGSVAQIATLPFSSVSSSVAAGLEAMNAGFDAAKTDHYAASTELYQARRAVETAGSNYRKQVDIDTGTPELVASLRHIGREALSAINNTAGDTNLMVDLLGQAVGSMGGAGKLAQGLGKGSTLAKNAISGFGNKAAAAVASGADEAIAAANAAPSMFGRAASAVASKEAVALGLTEGGGAATGAINEIGRLSEDVLAKDENYQELRKTMSHEDARDVMARNGGLVAFGIAAPIGIAVGGLASKVIANPFGKGNGIAERAVNLGKETTEEGGQGFSGSVAQNIGVQQFGDANKAWDEDVGENVGKGMLGGFGSVAALQGPGAALLASTKGAVAAGGLALKGAGKTAGYLANKIGDVGKKQLAKEEAQDQELLAATPGTAENVIVNANKAVEDKLSAMPEPEPIQNEDGSSTPPPPKALPEDDFLHPNRVQVVGGSADLNAVADSSATSIEKVVNLANYAKQETTSAEDRVSAVTSIVDFVSSESTSKSQEEVKTKLLSELSKLPNIKETIERVAALVGETSTDESISEQELTTPEGKAKLNALVLKSILAPASMQPGDSERVLFMADNPNSGVGEGVKKLLRLSQATSDATKEFGELERLFPRKKNETNDASQVNDQLLSSGKAKNSESNQLGLVQHLGNLQKAIASGDSAAVESALMSIAGIAQHYSNKASALEESRKAGKNGFVKFARWGGKNWMIGDTSEGARFLNNEKGAVFASVVSKEADVLSGVWGKIQEQFEEQFPEEFAAVNERVFEGNGFVSHRFDKALAEESFAKLSNKKADALAGADSSKPVAEGYQRLKPASTNSSDGKKRIQVSEISPTKSPLSTFRIAVIESDPKSQNVNILNADGKFKESSKVKRNLSTQDMTLEQKQQLQAEVLRQVKEVGTANVDVSEMISSFGNKASDAANQNKGKAQAAAKKAQQTVEGDPRPEPPMEDSEGTQAKNELINSANPNPAPAASQPVPKPKQKPALLAATQTVVENEAVPTAAPTTAPAPTARKKARKPALLSSPAQEEVPVNNELDLGPDTSGQVTNVVEVNGKKVTVISTPRASIHRVMVGKQVMVVDARNVVTKLSDGKPPAEKNAALAKEAVSLAMAKEDVATKKASERSKQENSAPEAAPVQKPVQTSVVEESRPTVTAVEESPQEIDIGITNTKESVVDAPIKPNDVEANKASGIPRINNSFLSKVLKTVRSKIEKAGVVIKEKSVSVAEAYPSLYKDGDTDSPNWFTRNFRVDPNNKGLLSSVNLVLYRVVDMLSDSAATKEALAGMGTLSAQGRQDWQKYIVGLGIVLKSNMDARLAKMQTTADGKYVLSTGKNPLGNPKYKALNFAQLVDGKLQYSPEIAEAITLAVAQWLISDIRGATRMDKQRVSEIYGSRFATAKGVAFFSEGMSTKAVTDSLARRLERTLGVTAKDNKVLLGLSEGLFKALALEVIASLSTKEAGVLVKTEMTFEEVITPDGRKLPSVTFTQHQIAENSKPFVTDTKKQLRAGIGEFPNLIDALLGTEDLSGFLIGDEAPRNIPDTQNKNKNNKLTVGQKESIDSDSKTPSFLNKNNLELMFSLGVEFFQDILGGRERSTDNENYALSKDSKRSQIRNSFESLINLVQSVSSYAEANGTELDKVPVRMNLTVGANNRQMQQEAYSPQANKIIREVLLPTVARIDMSDPNIAVGYWGTLAQSMGLKVDKVMPANLFKSLDERTKHPDVIAAMESINSFQEGNELNEQDFINIEKGWIAFSGNAPTVVAFHGLVDYTRLMAGGTDSSMFETSLYLEADGVNNGPTNLIGIFSVGEFTTKWIESMNRGGLYLNRRNMTTNEFLALPKEPGQETDTYTAVGKQASINLKNILKELVAVLPREYASLLTVFNKLLDNSFSTGYAPGIETVLENLLIEIKRGLAKTPTTQVGYSAGVSAVSNTLTNVITDQFYKLLSEANQKRSEDPTLSWDQAFFPGVVSDGTEETYRLLSALLDISTLAVAKKKGKTIFFKTKDTHSLNGILKNLKGFSFTPEMVAGLNTAVRATLGTAMYEAISQEVLEHSRFTSSAIVAATQIQVVVAKDLYEKHLMALLASKNRKPVDGVTALRNKSDLLSREEAKELYEKVKHLLPIIYTNQQAITVVKEANAMEVTSKGKKGNNLVYTASDITESTRSVGEVSTFSTPGVAAMAFSTISGGDALMMHLFSLMTADPANQKQLDGLDSKRTLGIFDGGNMPVDAIGFYGAKYNEAAHAVWLENHVKGFYEAFKLFRKSVSNDTVFSIIEDKIEELGNEKIPASFGHPVSKRDVNENIEHIKYIYLELEELLREASMSAGDRATVLSRVVSSTDQMAASMAAHTHIPENPIPLSEDATNQEIADAMNAELVKLAEERNKAKEELSKKGTFSGWSVLNNLLKTPLSNSRKKILQLFADFGESKSFLLGLKIVSNTKQNVYEQLVLDMNKYGFVIDPEQLEQIKNKKFKAFYVRSNNTIYTNSLNSEEIAHEMLHAATVFGIASFYNNAASKANGRVRPYFKMLETQLQSFLDKDLSKNFSGQSLSDYTHVRDVITSILGGSTLEGASPEQMIQAISEFIAYGLTNQSLSDILKRESAPPSVWKTITKMLSAIRSTMHAILFGKTYGAMQNSQYDAMFFNAQNIMAYQQRIGARSSNGDSKVFFMENSEKSLQRLSASIDAKIGNYLSTPEESGNIRLPNGLIITSEAQNEVLKKKMREGNYANGLVLAQSLSKDATTNGFLKTPQEIQLYEKMVTLAEGVKTLEPLILQQANDIYVQALSEAKPKDFLPAGVTEATATAIQKVEAARKFSFLNGFTEGRLGGKRLMNESGLSSFLALSMADDSMREFLSKRRFTDHRKNKGIQLTFDQNLENIGVRVMDTVQNMITGVRKSANDLDALSGIVTDLVQLEGKNDSLLVQADNKVTSLMELADNKVTAFVRKQANALAKKRPNTATRLLAQAVDPELSNSLGEGLLTGISHIKSMEGLKRMLVDAVGRTDSNGVIYDYIKRTKYLVQQIRQQGRDHIPKTLNAKFKNKLGRHHWSLLYTTIGKADLASLLGFFTLSEIGLMLSDPKELDKAKARLLAADKTLASETGRAKRQAKALMGTGIVEEQSLLKDDVPGGALVEYENLSRLSSIEAIYLMTDAQRKATADLIKSEKAGMEFLLNYIKNTNWAFRKGEYPILVKNKSLIVADISEESKLLRMGFVKQGNVGYGNLATYFLDGSAGSHYEQGIFQTVRRNGYRDRQSNHYVLKSFKISENPELEKMVEAGEIKNMYIDGGEIKLLATPAELALLSPTTELDVALGMRQSRHVEEQTATAHNENVWESIKSMYENASEKDKHRYIDILKTKDPVIKKSAELIVAKLLEMGIVSKKSIQKESIMIREDLIDDIIGYHSATSGDFWTGNSRWSPEVQAGMRKILTSVLGKDAYLKLQTAEDIQTNLVKSARNLIVVKSILVPAGNMVSTLGQLLVVGVPMNFMVNEIPKKLSEINAYTRLRVRQVELDVEITATTDKQQQARLIGERENIDKAYRRLSIWPLIEAGEFTAINDATLSQDDNLLVQGKLNDYIESAVNKLPSVAKSVGRQVFITQDTALYKALNKSVQYTDFIAKAVLFDHLTKAKKKPIDIALQIVSDEFVNYERLPGRFRGSLESLGVIWFWNYKIRTIKVAARMLRDNPFKSLMFAAVPMPDVFGSVGLPITDNFVAKTLDGSITGSIGFGQGFGAPSLHPIVGNIF